MCLNCYAWGTISIPNGYSQGASYSTWVGGFSGGHQVSKVAETFKNCYCAQTETASGSGYTGQLPTGTTTHGFGGNRDVIEATTTLFYDTTTSSIEESPIGEGNITRWMQTLSSYEDAGWDFDTIWYMPPLMYWRV